VVKTLLGPARSAIEAILTELVVVIVVMVVVVGEDVVERTIIFNFTLCWHIHVAMLIKDALWRRCRYSLTSAHFITPSLESAFSVGFNSKPCGKSWEIKFVESSITPGVPLSNATRVFDRQLMSTMAAEYLISAVW